MADTTGRPKLTDLNEHLVCTLCNGYLIDATSIVECLHSFCRSCIVRYLQASSFCPRCEVQLHKGSPLRSLKPDKTLQDIVYKLVPNLFHKEILRRKTYYDAHPEYVLHTTPEQRGDGVERFYSTDDKFSLSLEYVSESDPVPGAVLASPPPSSANKALVLKHYLQCPTLFTIRLLKKFVRNKLDLPNDVTVDIYLRRESLSDDYTLLDVAYIYPWKKSAPMSFYYRVTDPTAAAVSVPVNDVEREMPSLRPAAPYTPSPRVVRAYRRSASVEQTPKAAAPVATTVIEPAERRPPPLPSLVIKGLPVSSSATGTGVTYTVTLKTPSPPQTAPPKTPKMNGARPTTPTETPIAPKTDSSTKPVPMATFVTKLKTLAPKSLKSRSKSNSPAPATSPAATPTSAAADPRVETPLTTATPSASAPSRTSAPKPKQKPVPIVPKPYAGFVAPPGKPNPKVNLPVKIAPKTKQGSESEASTALSNAVSLLQSNGITVSTSPSPNTTSTAPKTPRPDEPPMKATPAPAVAAPVLDSPVSSPGVTDPAAGQPTDEDTAKVETAQAILQLSMGFKRSLSPPDAVLSRRISAIVAEMNAVKSEPNSPRSSPSPPSILGKREFVTEKTDPTEEGLKKQKVEPTPSETPRPKPEAPALLPAKNAPKPPQSMAQTSAVITLPVKQTSQSDAGTPSQEKLSVSSQAKSSTAPQPKSPNPSEPKPSTTPLVSKSVLPAQPKPSTPSQLKPSTPSQTKPSTPSQTKPSTPVQTKPVTSSQAKPSAPSQTKTSTPSQTKTSTPSQPKQNTPAQPKPTIPSHPKSVPASQAKSSTPTQPKPLTPSQQKAVALAAPTQPKPLTPSQQKAVAPAAPTQPKTAQYPQAKLPQTTQLKSSQAKPVQPAPSQPNPVTPITAPPKVSPSPKPASPSLVSKSSSPGPMSPLPKVPAPLSSPSKRLNGTLTASPLSSPQGGQSSNRSTPPPLPPPPSLKRPAAASPVDTKSSSPTPNKQQRIKDVDKIAQAIKQKRLQDQPLQKSSLNFFFDGLPIQAASPAKLRKPVPDLQRLPRLVDRSCGGAPLDLSASSPRASDHGGSWSPAQTSLAQVLARRQQVNGAQAPRPSSLSSSSPSPPAESPSAIPGPMTILELAQMQLMQQLHVQNLIREGYGPSADVPNFWELFGRHQAAAAAAAAASAAAGKRAK